jgi:hypothetical protein
MSPKDRVLAKYKLELVPIDQIKSSPENDELYGEMLHDEQMVRLIDSIRSRGLGDPLLLSKDNFILSGHRRFYAISQLGWTKAPCYFSNFRRKGNAEFHSVLAEYNPQRVKTVARSS